ncbi:MAG: methyltransferase C-terminal domain-containing protein, partial [Hyphomicrobiaceae bacterium]
DTIYHEHFSYFSAVSVERLAARHGLRIVDIEELPTHGGSLRVYLAHAASSHEPTASVARIIEAEKARNFLSLSGYQGFQDEVRTLKHELLALLIQLKRDGKSIVGYGAPGKGNTLLNYCGIGPDFLDFTVDRNPYKHGRFTPGMRIPILAPKALDEARPDYVLILPWNIKTEIIRQLQHIKDWNGRFIVPVPRPEILSPGSEARP